MSPAIQVNDLSWLIGGPQGSGVDSSANVFARACAAGGLNVFGKREFYSNIMGEHSYFALRAHTNLVRSHIDSVNVLATFVAEQGLRLEGRQDVHGIDVRSDEVRVGSQGVGETLDDMLAASKRRGVALVP